MTHFLFSAPLHCNSAKCSLAAWITQGELGELITSLSLRLCRAVYLW